MQMKKQMYKTRNNTIKNRYSLLIGLIVFIMFSCNQTGQVFHSSLDNFKFINSKSKLRCHSKLLEIFLVSHYW
jgi:hypothetical protein